MSTNSTTTPIEAPVLGPVAESTGAAGADPPDTAASSGLQQDDLPTPECLDPQWIKEGVPDTKFYKDYPPDAWGEEALPNARVWKIYRDERTTADAAMLKSWNSTLDVLLIFAGLFSAVSTAFIVESYKSLQPDYTQYIANFLYAAAAARKSAANVGIMILPAVDTMGPPDSFVRPSVTSRWTNGLWFTSLVISLTVALLCILDKQWLDEYHGRITRSAPSFRDWARRHQLYYRGLNSWGVPVLISLLPLLLHISLFLFFAGLVLFLRPLDGAIANMLLAVLAVVLLFYVLALVLPALRIDCPSYMPLLTHAQSVMVYGLRMLHTVINSLSRRLIDAAFDCHVYCDNHPHFRPCYRALVFFYFAAGRALDQLRSLRARYEQSSAWREKNASKAQLSDLDGWALTTLLKSTNNGDIIDAGIEAIGAICAEPALKVILRNVPATVIDDRICGGILKLDATSSAFSIMTGARRVRTSWVVDVARRRMEDFASVPYGQRRMSLLYPFLGTEGIMIHLLAVDAHRGPIDRDLHTPVVLLLRQLLFAHTVDVPEQSLEAENNDHITSSRMSAVTRPSRGTSLLFLCMLALPPYLRGIHLWQHHIPCRLLTFCAGNFAQGDSHEQLLALRAVRGDRVLHMMANNSVRSSGNGDECFDSLGRVFAMFATHEEYRENVELARLFAHHLGLLSESMCRSLTMRGLRSLRWAQIAGFAVFSQLPNFEQYVSREGLNGYMALLENVEEFSTCDGGQPFQQYWTCVATLVILCCNVGLPSDRSLWKVNSLVGKIAGLLRDTQRAASFLDCSRDTILSMFLQIPSAVGSRMIIPTMKYSSFTTLAEGFASALCRRQRVGVIDTGRIESLFSGSFLANQFRRRITEHAHSQAMTMAKHCARLSLDGMLHICDELEYPSGGETALGEDEVAFVGRIRRGLQPGGELSGECERWCNCMPAQHAARHPADSTRIGWRRRLIRGLRSASSEVPV